MIINYQIIAVIPEEHQIKVRFTSDVVPESEMVSAWMPDGVTPRSYRTDYLITLPVPAPKGEELDKYIMAFCPVQWFKLKAALANPNIDTTLDIAIGMQKTIEV
jgi:hypothetical protein